MASLYTRRVLIIVREADRARANGYAVQFDPDAGGGDTFSVALSASGELPATHRMASTQMTEPTYQQVLALAGQAFPGARIEEYDLETEPDRPDQVLAELGLRRIAAPVTGGEA